MRPPGSQSAPPAVAVSVLWQNCFFLRRPGVAVGDGRSTSGQSETRCWGSLGDPREWFARIIFFMNVPLCAPPGIGVTATLRSKIKRLAPIRSGPVNKPKRTWRVGSNLQCWHSYRGRRSRRCSDSPSPTKIGSLPAPPKCLTTPPIK